MSTISILIFSIKLKLIHVNNLEFAIDSRPSSQSVPRFLKTFLDFFSIRIALWANAVAIFVEQQSWMNNRCGEVEKEKFAGRGWRVALDSCDRLFALHSSRIRCARDRERSARAFQGRSSLPCWPHCGRRSLCGRAAASAPPLATPLPLHAPRSALAVAPASSTSTPILSTHVRV